jgi:hypothetical protein
MGEASKSPAVNQSNNGREEVKVDSCPDSWERFIRLFPKRLVEKEILILGNNRIILSCFSFLLLFNVLQSWSYVFLSGI